MTGKLYLAGTPIGNLNDMSPRLREAFEVCDFIAAEDTRVTLKLLNHLGMKKPLVSYYEHNRVESGEKIIARLLNGETCTLVSDAGMPAISDPGEDLVRLCAENGIEVTVIPGPCAAICALAASGLPTGRFTFEGFLSVSKKSRFDHLKSLVTEQRTMIFYEAPHKLTYTLKDMEQYFGSDRRISVSRELTKHYEETLRMTLGEAVIYFDANPPRGEFVLIVEGAKPEEKAEMTLEEAAELARGFREGGMSLKEASKKAAEESGLSRKTIYDFLANE